MTFDLSRCGLYLVLRHASEDHDGIGLVIKPARYMVFSERNGGWRGAQMGPVYLRTYRRRS